MTPSVVAFIPARRGSKRVPGKNVRTMGGHPMIAYSISAARESGIFQDVIVSTDDDTTARISRHYGATVPFMRPDELAADVSADIGWVSHAVEELEQQGVRFDCFSILRPSNPFRQAETIRRAWEVFRSEPEADSLRAVEKCRQHPAKMWVLEGNRIEPLLKGGPVDPPWHSMPYESLPPVYAQNASLEIAWTRVVTEKGSIAGDEIVPFFTSGYEGLDINYPNDWHFAEQLVASGDATLPSVKVAPITNTASGAAAR